MITILEAQSIFTVFPLGAHKVTLPDFVVGFQDIQDKVFPGVINNLFHNNDFPCGFNNNGFPRWAANPSGARRLSGTLAGRGTTASTLTISQ